MTGLQNLHGFDMTWQDPEHRLIAHGPPDEHVKPPSEIAADLDRWPTNRHDYDADPEKWFARTRARVRDQERPQRVTRGVRTPVECHEDQDRPLEQP